MLDRAPRLPCPLCAYQASSLTDLEAHGSQAHAIAKERATPFVKAAGPQETQPEASLLGGVALQVAPPALAIPSADPTFWVDEPISRFLQAVERRSQNGEIVNVLLVGPTGTGKSSLPKEFAASWQRLFFTMHCQLVTEPGDWWGTKEMAPDKGTYFQKAALVDAVETPGCIILLDEANRTYPENLNALFGFLDHRHRAWIPVLHREVVVAPGVVFFVTLNEGIDYVGTSALDAALRDRISTTIRLNYLPRKTEAELLVKRTGIDEKTARKLAEFAHTVRHNPKLAVAVSPRQILECAALVKAGLPHQEAVMFAIVNGASEDVDRKALLQSLQVSGGVSEAYVQGFWDEEE